MAIRVDENGMVVSDSDDLPVLSVDNQVAQRHTEVQPNYNEIDILMENLPDVLDYPDNLSCSHLIRRQITRKEIELISKRLRNGGFLSSILRLLRIPEPLFYELMEYGRASDNIWSVVDLVVAFSMDNPISTCLEVILSRARAGDAQCATWFLKEYAGVEGGNSKPMDEISPKNKEGKSTADDMRNELKRRLARMVAKPQDADHESKTNVEIVQ